MCDPCNKDARRGVKAALLRTELQWERIQRVPSHTLETASSVDGEVAEDDLQENPQKGAPVPVGGDTSRSVCKRSARNAPRFLPAKSRLSLKFHSLFSARWYLSEVCRWSAGEILLKQYSLLQKRKIATRVMLAGTNAVS